MPSEGSALPFSFVTFSMLGVRKGGLPPLLWFGLLNQAGVNHPSGPLVSLRFSPMPLQHKARIA